MKISRDTIDMLQNDVPLVLQPILSFVLGLFHLFPLCCVVSFCLAEIGITIESYFPSFGRGDFLSWLQSFESDFYDDNRRMHICRFHALKVESMIYARNLVDSES